MAIVEQASKPVLIVDLGNTLIIRPTGAYRRVMEILDSLTIVRPNEELRLWVARIVLTGADPVSASNTLATRFDLANETVESIRLAIRQNDGPATVMEGAEELLRKAGNLGWEVIAATNSVASLPPIPEEIGIRIKMIFSSHEVGALKQDPAFWAALQTRFPLDPTLSLVVGDSAAADVEAPQLSGLNSLLIGPLGVTLSSLTSSLEELGTMHSSAVALIVGRLVPWGGRLIIDAPNLDVLVRDRTRFHCTLQTMNSQLRASVIRRKSQPPAVVTEVPLSAKAGTLILGWLVPMRDRRTDSPPSDMIAAIEREGITMDGLPLTERRHLVSLVRESKNPEVRTERIREAVTFLKERVGYLEERF